jgi:hypothetical protein
MKKSAVEMTGGGLRWKTLVSRYESSKLDIEFPTAAPHPWKSPKTRFPHSHSAGYGFTYPNHKDKSQTCALRAPRLAEIRERRNARSSDHRSLKFQAHPALESRSEFRLTLHWNEKSISGSFLDWKMLQLPAPAVSLHLTLGRQEEPLRYRETSVLTYSKLPIWGGSSFDHMGSDATATHPQKLCTLSTEPTTSQRPVP